jgi:hypothetical protein
MWRQISSIILGIFISACGTGGGLYYGTYETPGTNEKDQSILAILDWGACKHWWSVSCGVWVHRLPDGKVPDGLIVLDMEGSRKYSRVALEPGIYSVGVGYLSGGFMEPDRFSYNNVRGTFEMQSGHKYLVKKDQWSKGGLSGPFVISWWIEDEITGEVMAGVPPPANLPWYQLTPL